MSSAPSLFASGKSSLGDVNFGANATSPAALMQRLR
jgi:hypothetical protein